MRAGQVRRRRGRRAEEKEQTPWPHERLKLRERLSVDPNGSQRDHVDRIVQRRAREQFLESNRLDCRPIQLQACARLRAGTRLARLRLDHSQRDSRRSPASSESPASRLPSRCRARLRPATGRYFVARTGSMSSLSMASSPASSTGSAVRETLRFHFRSSSKYAFRAVNDRSRKATNRPWKRVWRAFRGSTLLSGYFRCRVAKRRWREP